jgi:hypothetical protein
VTCQIPSEYQTYVTAAAKATGMSQAVICAQINEESGWNPDAQSDAGAEGIAQFEPGTFSGQGCSGTPYNPGDAFACYSKYMSSLLTEEGGSVQKALEAYNAGPGNLAAGAGYADTILSNAGQGVSTSATPSGGGGGSSCVGATIFGHCLGIETSDIEDWLERGALMAFGGLLIIVGLVMFLKGPSAKTYKPAKDNSQEEDDNDNDQADARQERMERLLKEESEAGEAATVAAA